MKANKFFIALLMGAAALVMSAQDSYNRVSIGFSSDFFNGKTASVLNADADDIDDMMSLPGFNAQYVHGFGIGQQPLFVEVGVKGAMNFKSSSNDYDEEYKLTKLTVVAPVNLTYRIACGNGVSVQPYSGFNFKVNVLGKLKYEDSKDDDDLNLFDKGDVKKEYQWKRFQMGWQIGCGFNFSRYYAALEYGLDFMSLYKKTNTSHFDVNFGIYF